MGRYDIGLVKNLFFWRIRIFWNKERVRRTS